MCLSDRIQKFQDLKWKLPSNKTFKSGDIFSLKFNFKENSIQIYYNGKKTDKISLNGDKSIIPAISLKYTNDAIQIIKHSFF